VKNIIHYGEMIEEKVNEEKSPSEPVSLTRSPLDSDDQQTRVEYGYDAVETMTKELIQEWTGLSCNKVIDYLMEYNVAWVDIKEIIGLFLTAKADITSISVAAIRTTFQPNNVDYTRLLRLTTGALFRAIGRTHNNDSVWD
jgi:hypothetical protein